MLQVVDLSLFNLRETEIFESVNKRNAHRKKPRLNSKTIFSVLETARSGNK